MSFVNFLKKLVGVKSEVKAPETIAEVIEVPVAEKVVKLEKKIITKKPAAAPKQSTPKSTKKPK
jgi:hypothetical protein